ncbi:MAG TPA: isoleucine--tRNA ligase [Phycisphaerae bacterium]
MPFEKVDPKVNFPAQEVRVLEFWERVKAFETLRAQNAGQPRWSFLDGPITANNPMGVHHAWGRTYKDVFCRYHAAKGFDERYQNGFDCQGLWIEVEVEKEHGFSDKRQIEAYGIDKFVEECKARALKFSAIQTRQSIRLGYWMDWNNSYYTLSDENNYAIWHFLKKCHEQSLVYKGSDVMPWCPRCGTGISQMEMNEGYHETEHLSVFVRFPIRRPHPGPLPGGESVREALLVWTTTPWTLTSNVAAAVRPGMPYVKVRSGDWIYYIGKANFEAARKQPVELADKSATPSLMNIQTIVRGLGGADVLEELDGSQLVGLTYDGPFDHLPGAQPAVAAHRVIPWAEVTESEGSGIVHIAPGCGAADYQLGKALRLPAIAPLEENGRFKAGFGELTGKQFNEVAEQIANDLKARGLLVARERYLHRYPHCWRCKTELVYRLVDEWFINMSWRERIMNAARSARWIPAWGLERELDWLRNMGDWMISKKRYWGLALPIWECAQCGQFEVIGGRDELQARAASGWENFEGHSPHRPWIDHVKIRCGKCGNQEMSRVKDVGNPWLDASIVPFSTMGYFTDRANWEKWFPPDFIVESLPGQFRNWFYALLAISTMLVDRAPFKTLLGHGLVLDDNFEEMHKSKGNAIWFDEAADKIGADTMRWMFCAHAPERNLAFGPKHADETRKKIITLWNVYKFFADLASVDQFDPAAERIPVLERSDLDRWILSDLQQLIEVADKSYSEFDVQTFCQRCERFVDDLSTWYLRRSRRRFYASGWPADKRAAYATLYEVLDTLIQLIAPILPFTAEAMYQNLVVGGHGGVAFEGSGFPPRRAGRVQGSVASSVHHRPFPKPDPALVNHDLSEHVGAFLHVVSLARSARTENKLKVRQPLAELIVVPGSDAERAALEKFKGDLLEELNVKRATLRSSVADLCRVDVKLNLKLAGPKYGKQVGAITKALSSIDAAQVAARVARNDAVPVQIDGEIVALSPAELIVSKSYSDAYAAAEDQGTITLIDRRVTEELKLEGLARDIVRNVQNLRKDADLNIEDRIVLSLQTDSPALQSAIRNWRGFIAEETLAVELRDTALESFDGRTEVEIEGNKVRIALARAPAAAP